MCFDCRFSEGFVFTVWPGITPEQLWSFTVDPSGQRGDTETQYLLAALSSTDTDTATSDSNVWTERGELILTLLHNAEELNTLCWLQGNVGYDNREWKKL